MYLSPGEKTILDSIVPKIIAVDFDDTVVIQKRTSKYPEVGITIPKAVEVLKALVACKHRLILWTVRDQEQDGIDLAINWYVENKIPLYGVLERPKEESIEDSKNMRNSKSPKVRANLYIDDAALGCPLIDGTDEFRPYVDWYEAQRMLREIRYLP